MHANAKPIDRLLTAVTGTEASPDTRRRYSRWVSAEPDLAGWGNSPAELVAACRTAPLAAQDRVVACLIGLFSSDELAQLTVLAVTARALGAVLAEWARAGVSPADLAELETDLVSAAWEAAAQLAARADRGEPLPDRPARWVRDQARQAVLTRRRRQRRRQRVTLSLPEVHVAALSAPVAEALAGELVAAFGSKRLTRAEAASVFMTRVAGLDVTDAASRLGMTAGSLRAVRSRGERRLIASAA